MPSTAAFTSLSFCFASKSSASISWRRCSSWLPNLPSVPFQVSCQETGTSKLFSCPKWLCIFLINKWVIMYLLAIFYLSYKCTSILCVDISFLERNLAFFMLKQPILYLFTFELYLQRDLCNHGWWFFYSLYWWDYCRVIFLFEKLWCSALEPSSLHRAVYPVLTSYSSPDKQAYPRHSLSRAALITSGSPIFFLDAFTTLVVFYSSTADPTLQFPPPHDCKYTLSPADWFPRNEMYFVSSKELSFASI